jgi:WD repeat-containing protein 92
MDTTDAPQIIEHVSKSLTFTPFDTKWIPCSARFVLFGQSPKAKGVF